jgi:Amidohydrolase
LTLARKTSKLWLMYRFTWEYQIQVGTMLLTSSFRNQWPRKGGALKLIQSISRSSLLALLVIFTLGSASQVVFAQEPASQSSGQDAVLKAFAALHPIDAHVHVFKTGPSFQSFLEKANLTLLNVLVVDDTLSYRKELPPQVSDALALVRASHGHVAWCTTFDAYNFNAPSFQADSIKQIDENFKQGALAVKVWKNIGMEIKDAQGKFIMPDDPKLLPIYQDIAKHDKTLMMHDAEPDVAWGPPDPSDPSWSYYKENPQWFLYKRPGFPSKREILDARDHVLVQNPKLRIVGVHLGSMEKDLDGVGKVMDRYPNFAIDTAARMEYLMLAPTEKVRAFLTKYQDRVLYGTDLDLIETADLDEAVKDWQTTYIRDWKFLATDETFEVNGKRVQGLKLPQAILAKLYRANSLKWIPGLK